MCECAEWLCCWCLLVCVFMHMRVTQCFQNCKRLPGSLTFSLFHSLFVDYAKTNVNALRALCHCLALSIKLTSVPNPSIVLTEWLLSATVSRQSGENEQSPSVPQRSKHETMQRMLSISSSFFFSMSSLSLSLCTHPCLFPSLPSLLFSCSLLLFSLT